MLDFTRCVTCRAAGHRLSPMDCARNARRVRINRRRHYGAETVRMRVRLKYQLGSQPHSFAFTTTMDVLPDQVDQ